MKQNKTIKTCLKFAGAAMALLVVGCQTDKSSMTDFFSTEEERSTQNFMTAQAAAGARADGTLRPMHFDGDKLNSLGEAKLDLMLKDDDTTDAMVVYMDLMREDPTLKGRRDAIVNYLEDRGITKDHVEFKMGTNPNSSSLAASHIAGLSKTESTVDTQSGGTAPSMGAGGTSGAASK